MWCVFASVSWYEAVCNTCLAVVEQMVEQSVIDTLSSYFRRVRMFNVLPGFVMHPEINASLLLFG